MESVLNGHETEIVVIYRSAREDLLALIRLGLQDTSPDETAEQLKKVLGVDSSKRTPDLLAALSFWSFSFNESLSAFREFDEKLDHDKLETDVDRLERAITSMKAMIDSLRQRIQ